MKSVLIFLLILCPIFLLGQTYFNVGRVNYTDQDLGQKHNVTITAGNTLKYFVIDTNAFLKVNAIAYNSFTRSKTFNLTIKIADDGYVYRNSVRVFDKILYIKKSVKVTLKKVGGIVQPPILIY